MTFIKDIGDLTSRGFTGIKSNITGVNVVKWGIIPGLFTALITLVILFFLKVPISGTTTHHICETKKQDGEDVEICQDKEISNKYNILMYIFLPIIFAFVVGSFIFKLGIMVNNPKLGVGIVGANMIKNAVSK